MQFAVIDCGTNVFNLLIAEIMDGTLKINSIHKIPVQLFKGSKTPQQIPQSRMIRGLDALHSFFHTLRSHQIDTIKCVATSAVREAENGREFVELVREKLGLEIDVITGEEEARLIYYGVQFSGILDHRKTLLIDIGGGSVEFSLCEKNTIHMTISLPVGVSRLKEKLQHVEILGKQELQTLKQYLNEPFTELKSALAGHKIERCIGTSGSFDTLFNILKSSMREGEAHAIMSYDVFEQIHQWIIKIPLEDRLKDPRILPERAEYLPYATALISYLLELTGPMNFEHCNYNLKEGLATRFARELGWSPQ